MYGGWDTVPRKAAVVTQCKASGGAFALGFVGTTVVEVSNNIFFNNVAYHVRPRLVSVSRGGSVTTGHVTHFKNNLFMSHESDAERGTVWLTSPDCQFHNNIFTGVNTAIYTPEVYDLQITHNLFHDVRNFVDEGGSGSGNDLDFWELFANNASNNLLENPQLVNPLSKDFQLRASSPAINAGTNAFAPAIDFEGLARPAGGTVDIGPYEYGGTPITEAPEDPVKTPVVEDEDLSVIVRLSPSPVESPAVGEQLTLSLNITDGENVVGYQATIAFDTSALRYVESANGDYLSTDALFVPPVIKDNTVTLAAATSLAGEGAGDGTLATLTFEIVAAKASTLMLSEVFLADATGAKSRPQVEIGEITERQSLSADINGDGIVNIQDLVLVAANFGETGENVADVNADGVVDITDLVLVAGMLLGRTASGAPSAWLYDMEVAPTSTEVRQWLREARQVSLTDPAFQGGIRFLEQLLAVLTPKETALLPNYPNPFNPETWIPYQLANPAVVSISIHTADGKLVRTLALGNQPTGMYQSRSRAAYWDGRNEVGESVASGVYFYMLTAGDFTATKKMLIRK